MLNHLESGLCDIITGTIQKWVHGLLGLLELSSGGQAENEMLYANFFFGSFWTYLHHFPTDL